MRSSPSGRSRRSSPASERTASRTRRRDAGTTTLEPTARRGATARTSEPRRATADRSSGRERPRVRELDAPRRLDPRAEPLELPGVAIGASLGREVEAEHEARLQRQAHADALDVLLARVRAVCRGRY